MDTTSCAICGRVVLSSMVRTKLAMPVLGPSSIWLTSLLTLHRTVLLGGYAPFDAPECELAELITSGNYEFHEEYWSDDEIPPAAKDLIVHLLQVDPDDRYTPKEALECRWLRRKDRDLAESWHESSSSFASWLEHRNTGGGQSLLDSSNRSGR